MPKNVVFSLSRKKQFETVAVKGQRDVKFDGESISDGFEAVRWGI